MGQPDSKSGQQAAILPKLLLLCKHMRMGCCLMSRVAVRRSRNHITLDAPQGSTRAKTEQCMRSSVKSRGEMRGLTSRSKVEIEYAEIFLLPGSMRVEAIAPH